MDKLWILEDEAGARFVYKEVLSQKYEVEFFENFEAFYQALVTRKDRPQLCITDLHLPDRLFTDYLKTKEGQATMADVNFLVVTSLDERDALDACFDAGCLDYISKPFGRNELLVKVANVLETDRNGIRLDPVNFCLRKDDRSSGELTSKEYKIMTMILASPDFMVTRDSIVEKIWKKTNVSTKSLDVHVFNLRKKLSPLNLEVRASQKGYRLIDLSEPKK